MLGPDISAQAVSHVGPVPAPVRPVEPEQRVVEDTAQTNTGQQEPGSELAQSPQTSAAMAIQRLSTAARIFASILDSTGDVEVASTVSGFRTPRLDTYA